MIAEESAIVCSSMRAIGSVTARPRVSQAASSMCSPGIGLRRRWGTDLYASAQRTFSL